MKRNWSKEEIEILRNKKAEGLGYSEIQKYLPNRSVDAINLKSSKLGISKDAGMPWTKAEEISLKKKCAEPLFLEEIQKLFPHRSLKALADKIKKLGIDREEQKRLAKKRKRREEYIEKINQLAELFSLQVNLSDFEDRYSEFSYTCSKGHSDETNYQKLYDSTYGCETCGKIAIGDSRRLSVSEILAKAKELNLEISIEGDYRNSFQLIDAKCLLCGKLFKKPTNAQRIMAGQKCRPCSMKEVGQKNALDIEIVREKLHELGIELLSKEYLNNHTDLSLKYLKCGHDNTATWNTLQGGKRKCTVCIEEAKATPSDYKAFAKRHCGEVVKIADKIELKSKWKCKFGHNFTRRFKDMRKFDTFCTTCNQGWGEGACRSILENAFKQLFPKVRLKEMISDKGKPLEFDCYNASLKIALEHQGMHHFKSQENWGGNLALVSQKKHDFIKSNFAQKNDIALLIIPEVGSLTPLEKVPQKIAEQLTQFGREVPQRLLELDINSIEIKSSRDLFIQEVIESANSLSLKILDPIVLAEHHVRVKCQNGHETLKTPRSIKYGFKCKQCRREEISKPVKLSDGRKFKSRKEAGDALGVNKTRINKAVLNKKKVKGVFVYDI